MIDAYAEAISQPPHSVNLSTPSKIILVQVVRNSCTAAIMLGDTFRRLKKCNIRLCSQPADIEESKGDSKSKQVSSTDGNQGNLQVENNSTSMRILGDDCTSNDLKVGHKRRKESSSSSMEEKKKQKCDAI